MATFNNGESGLSVRNKLNTIINKVEGVTSIDNDIDVTGTITSDGLTIEAATDPTIRLFNSGTVTSGEILGTLEFYQEDGSAPGAGVVASIEARNTDASSGAGSIAFTTGYSNSNNDRMLINSNGDISFYEDTGTTAKFFWDASAESLGIGTTTVTTKIDVNESPATGSGASNTNTIGAAFASLHGNTSGNDQAFAIRTTGSQLNGISGSAFVSQVYAPANSNALEVFTGGATPLVFGTSATERMRIDSDGDLTVKGGRIFVNESDNGNIAVALTRDADEGYVDVYSAGSITTSIRGNGDSYFNGGNIGIGTSSPSDFSIGDLVVGDGSGARGITIYSGNSSGIEGIIRFADGTSGAEQYQGQIKYDHSGNFMRFYTAATEAMRLDSSGNLLIGGTGTPTSSAKNLVLHNGTAPTGSATDGVILYAEDVSSSSELKVRDEAGNVTTLSPHNFDLIPEGPSEDMAWSYYSERDGKRINVDMLKAIRLLEQISGEKLVHMV